MPQECHTFRLVDCNGVDETYSTNGEHWHSLGRTVELATGTLDLMHRPAHDAMAV
jgi:hypothetical protein